MKSLLISIILAALIRPLESQITYTWNGSVNSSFSTAGNWTPLRQYMYANDILVIEKGGDINITNVNQITIARLIIRNNSNVSMSPSSGNPRILFIQGGNGEDLIIESGSGLSINCDNSKLDVFLKSGATAAISGTLRFSGNVTHGINSQDSLAVIFKNGSYFYQDSPGNVFSNNGIQNSVIFQNGSSFVFNNNNAANPFGLAAPGSKVRFEKGSNFIFAVNSNSPFSINGRSFSNIKVQNGVNVSFSDELSNGVKMDSVKVPTGSSIEFINNTGYPATIFINGNLNVNGLFRIAGGTNTICSVNFSGPGMQTFLGRGDIDFSESSCIFINNDIRLFRDIVVNCPVFHLNANIYGIGFKFVVRGKVISTQSYFGSADDKAEANSTFPGKFELKQNYPNPFNSQTNIEFQVPSSSQVNIKLYDISGKVISELLNENLQQGSYMVNYDSKDISSGVYFYTISAAGFTKTLKMIVVK